MSLLIHAEIKVSKRGPKSPTSNTSELDESVVQHQKGDKQLPKKVD